jgi:hypothetical protein
MLSVISEWTGKMTKRSRKSTLIDFTEAASRKQRPMDEQLLRIFQEKAYQDISQLVQLRIWELEGANAPKMLDYADKLKARAGRSWAATYEEQETAQQILSVFGSLSKKETIAPLTRIERAKLLAQNTSDIIDEFINVWLKSAGNEAELLTQVMAYEMGGLVVDTNWGNRILPELQSYINATASSIKERVEAEMGEPLPSFTSKRSHEKGETVILKFKNG